MIAAMGFTRQRKRMNRPWRVQATPRAFTQYRTVPHDRGYRLQTVIDWLRAQIKTPVFTGLPFGHVPTKVCLPVGAPLDLRVEGRDALLLWGHDHSGVAGSAPPTHKSTHPLTNNTTSIKT